MSLGFNGWPSVSKDDRGFPNMALCFSWMFMGSKGWPRVHKDGLGGFQMMVMGFAGCPWVLNSKAFGFQSKHLRYVCVNIRYLHVHNVFQIHHVVSSMTGKLTRCSSIAPFCILRVL